MSATICSISCAVFLMMGGGILVGEALYPHQARSQAQTLKALKKEADDAVQKGQAAQDQLAKTEQAVDDLRPGLVRGKLANKRVTILLTGDYPDAAEAARGALADAGATVAATVTLLDKDRPCPRPARRPCRRWPPCWSRARRTAPPTSRRATRWRRGG